MKLFFEEPADGGYPIEVHATNPDYVIVFLSDATREDHDGVCLSYWQLERICTRIREEFPQIERERAEREDTAQKLLAAAKYGQEIRIFND